MRSNQQESFPRIPQQNPSTQVSPDDDPPKLTPRAEQVISRDLATWAISILVKQGQSR